MTDGERLTESMKWQSEHELNNILAWEPKWVKEFRILLKEAIQNNDEGE